MSPVPPALVHVLRLRGFGWQNELAPDLTVAPDHAAQLPILASDGTPLGAAALPTLPPTTAEDTFSISNQVTPLTEHARNTTLRRLADTELDLLITILPRNCSRRGWSAARGAARPVA